jgi:mannose-6-phosphate isomerase-like protein (cupin superfamily)
MKTKTVKWENIAYYILQSKIIKQALAEEDHSLDFLLKCMRDNQQHALYLSGSRIDNDYCFGSLDIGMLFSILPEDGHASVPGFHAGSTEIYVTFKGSLIMECLEGDQLVEKKVSSNDVLILPPGQCHRVKKSQNSAASLIIKTNLRHEPGVTRCVECTRFKGDDICSLKKKWEEES